MGRILNLHIIVVTVLLLLGGSTVSAKKQTEGSIRRIPDVVFFDSFTGDSVAVEYPYAASYIYENERYVDFNTAVSKFLYDEMLQRFQTVTDDAMRRVAFNRMREFLRKVNSNPPLVGMVRLAKDMYLSDRVYMMLNDSLVAYNQELAAASAIKTHDYFRLTRWESTMYLREPHYLDAGATEVQTYLSRLKMVKTPVCIEDTLGVVDYDPTAFVTYHFVDTKQVEPWMIADMVAKYRFFSHVLKDEQTGKLVCTATQEELRLADRPWTFLAEVLDGLNDPGARVHYPTEAWTSDPEEAERMAREFFLAKNRGHSAKIYNNKGKRKKFYDPVDPGYGTSKYNY